MMRLMPLDSISSAGCCRICHRKKRLLRCAHVSRYSDNNLHEGGYVFAFVELDLSVSKIDFDEILGGWDV